VTVSMFSESGDELLYTVSSLEDLSLPQVILVESTWIHGLHGCSVDSMEFFLAVETPKFSFFSPWTVHRQST